MFSSKKLESISDQRNNNFNLLRIGAALAVVLSHSFILTGNEPNALLRILGYVSVNCFFLISGFLVFKSLLDRKSVPQFLRARALRIYPALLFSVLLCVFVVGLLFTTHSLQAYFLESQTISFLIQNSVLLVGDVVYHLTAVFNQGEVGSWVNAPIWTVFFEVYMYLGLAVIALVFQPSTPSFEKRLKTIIGCLAILSMAAFLAETEFKFITHTTFSNLVRFTALFSMGAALYLHRSHIRLSPWLFLAMVVLIGLSSSNPLLFNSTFYLFLGYLLLCLAYLPGGYLLKFNQLGDYSYGVYIFAYPIQQALVLCIPNIHSIELFLFSAVLTLMLAVFSWHFIESKALAKK
jgi:peptidoglycan/LPS O-acetylase OafA/YrhL